MCIAPKSALMIYNLRSRLSSTVEMDRRRKEIAKLHLVFFKMRNLFAKED